MTADGYSNKAFADDHGKGINTDNIQMSEAANNRSEKQLKYEEYDPYQHRTFKHPLSNNETIVHLLKASLGTGILAMPKAIYHAGYITGSIGTAIIGMICVYCVQMLLKSHYELCKRRRVPQMDYTSIVVNGVLEGPEPIRKYATLFKNIAIAFLLMCQIGGCGIYVVFVAENVKSIVDYASGTNYDVRLYMVIILLPMIFLNWIRNYKLLAPFSTLANFGTIISLGIICYFIVREPISFEGKRAFGPVAEFPFYFGTVLFSMEAIGVIIPLENEMKTPRAFVGLTGVLNRAIVIIVILYVAMGLFGYLRYGDAIRDSITLSLEINSKTDEILAQSVKGMLAFGIYITHGVACYVAIDLIWNKHLVNKVTNDRHKIFYEYLVRTVICTMTFVLAVAIPQLDFYISLIGALCLATLGIIFPALLDTCVFWRDTYGISRALLIIKNVLILCFGLFALLVGTGTNLVAIYQS